jgi:hypothetical protein
MRKKKAGIGIISLLLVSALAIGGIIAQAQAIDPFGQDTIARDYAPVDDASTEPGPAAEREEHNQILPDEKVAAVSTQTNSYPNYTIEHAESGARFSLEFVFAEITHEIGDAVYTSEKVTLESLKPMYISLEEAAMAGADAIFAEFGFNLDGMDGYIHLMDSPLSLPIWSMFIVSEELTTHSEGRELFYIQINAITGELIDARMNTPEMPFHG